MRLPTDFAIHIYIIDLFTSFQALEEDIFSRWTNDTSLDPRKAIFMHLVSDSKRKKSTFN